MYEDPVEKARRTQADSLQKKLEMAQRVLDYGFCASTLEEIDALLYIATYRYEALNDMIAKTIIERQKALRNE